MSSKLDPSSVEDITQALPILILAHWPIVLSTFLFIAFRALRNRPASRDTVERFFHNFRVGGHRGSPTKQPENTMESMRQAKTDGVDLVEFDVSLTKDGIAVLLHDDTLDRTTNLTGPIRSYLHSELAHCNSGAKFNDGNGSAVGGDPTPIHHALPTLDELVEWAKANEMKLLFDVKDSDLLLVRKLQTLFEAHPQLYHTSIVCSFFPNVVYRIKRSNPRILTGLTWRRWFVAYSDLEARTPRFQSPLVHAAAVFLDVALFWSIHTWLPSFLGVDLILTEHREISESFVIRQARKGRKVCAWTVNDVNEMAWMQKSLKIPFLTDQPHLAAGKA